VTGAAGRLVAPLRRTAGVFRVVLANGPLRRVELAYATFNAVEWATWIAMIVYAYEQGGETTAGLVALAQLVPAAVFAPIGASATDRFRPGRVLLVTYLVLAVACAATGVAMVDGGSTLLVYALGAVPATVLTLVRPSQAALTPGLARSPLELTALNVVSGWIESASVLVAPLLAGVLIDAFGTGTVFLVMGAAMLAGGLFVVSVPGGAAARRVERVESGGRAGPGVAELLRRDWAARALLAFFLSQYVAIGALDILYPHLAVSVLGQSSGWAGYLNAAFGLGGTIGILATASLVGRRRLMPSLLGGMALWVAAFVLLGASPGVVAALAFLTAAGVGRTVMDVSGRTLLQRMSREDLIARVFGVLESLSMAGLAAGAVLAPALVALGGTRVAFVGVALLLPLGAAFAGRRLLEIDLHADVPIVQIALLRTLPIFAPLDATRIEILARDLEPLTVEGGTAVVREGETGELFFVIASGEVDVTRGGEHVAALGRGDCFGEVALLQRAPRNATCTAVTPTQLYSLAREPFLEAVTGHPVAHEELHRLAATRVPLPEAEPS